MQFKDPRVSKKQKGSDSNNTARLTSSQIVILEGGDGVGKTSVGKNMAETLKGTYISTPTRGFKKIRNYVESLGSFESRFHYYLATVYDGLSEIRIKSNGSLVVCDRFVWSSIIGYCGLTNQSLNKVLGKYQTSLVELLNLDVTTILLTVNSKEQLQRLGTRESLGKTDALTLTNYSFIIRTNELFARAAEMNNWMIFDTSGMSVEVSSNSIIGSLGLLEVNELS